MVDPENMHFFYKELDDTVLEQVKRIIGQLFYFIADNPGDHYRLDLAKQYDRVILEKLLEINETDISYSKDTETAKGATYPNMAIFKILETLCIMM